MEAGFTRFREQNPKEVGRYFKLNQLQLHAAEIDGDESHPWNLLNHNGLIVEDGYGQVAFGVTYDSEVGQDGQFGLIILEKSKEGGRTYAFDINLSQKDRGQIVEILNTLAPSLPSQLRHEYVREVIKSLNNPSETTDYSAKSMWHDALNMLPSLSDNTSDIKIDLQSSAVGKPTKEQEDELTEFLHLAIQKVNPESVNSFVTEVQDWFNGESFKSDTYPGLFSAIGRLTLKYRQDSQRKYESIYDANPEPFDVSARITRPIKSEMELEQILMSIPAKTLPDVRHRRRLNKKAEMISLDTIVGGRATTNWLNFNASEGRGLPKIFELVTAYTNGRANIAGRDGDLPIYLMEVGGEYFVEGDGNHRVAALKALGVDQIPAIVSHVV